MQEKFPFVDQFNIEHLIHFAINATLGDSLKFGESPILNYGYGLGVMERPVDRQETCAFRCYAVEPARKELGAHGGEFFFG